MMKKPSILSATLIGACLLFSFKVTSIWQEASPLFAIPSAAAADGAMTSEMMADKESMKSGKAPKKGYDPALDPINFGYTEIELLQELTEKREEIESQARTRQHELDMREKLLAAAEQRIAGKIDELKELKMSVEKLIQKIDQEDESKTMSLVKIYETMKPKEAARIFDDLELGVLLTVMERMRETKASAIMAKMTPARAQTLTTELASRRKVANAVANPEKGPVE